MKIKEIPLEQSTFEEVDEQFKNPAYEKVEQSQQPIVSEINKPQQTTLQKEQVQLQAQKLAPVPDNPSGKAKYTFVPTHEDSSYERINLPSNCIFYDFDSLLMREFDANDLSLIHKAVIRKNFSLLVDAVGNTLKDVDVRSLTTKDFFFLMYHHRLNDYPSSPYNIPWTSRYGNDNVTQIKTSDLNIVHLKLTEEDYQAYKALGLRYPTVRDLEVLQIEEFEVEEKWLLERAQWVVGDDLQEKIKKVASFPIKILEAIRKFREESDHGVVERVMLRDQHFDPEKSIEHLRKIAGQVRELSKNIDTGLDEILGRVKDLEEEANTIEISLKEGKEILPAEEEVELEINALRFFPNI